MINYLNLHQSQEFYETKGFQTIEAPWTVTKAISQITKPKDKIDWMIEQKKKVLVASGEQSFLYLYLKGFLPKGAYQTITPCFRDESFDITHTKYFMKNELIDTENVNQERLIDIVTFCQEFMQKVLKAPVEIIHYTEGDSYDLECYGVEVGSYGIRRCEYLEWIYATGCAEPRLSNLQNSIKNGWIPRKGN